MGVDRASNSATSRVRRGMEAFAERDFTLYWWSRIIDTIGIEMLVVTVGWQVYGLTGEALDLGLVGLAQFAPFALLFLVTGLVADRFPRVRVMAGCVALQAICAASLFLMTQTGNTQFALILAVIILFGISRSFLAPVQHAIVIMLVPGEVFANAAIWTNVGNKVSRIAGPALGGLLIAVGKSHGEALVYGVAMVLLSLAFGLIVLIRPRAQAMAREPVSIDSLLAGLHFIWTRKVTFAVTALDLFAVFLGGGATALLPIFAKDVLDAGPDGFGILRAAFMGGAFIGGLILARLPVRGHAGLILLGTAVVFGFGGLIFGASTNFWLSMAVLAVMGAADMVSVVIRQAVVQLITPDEVRGRVSAAVSMVIGASNDLGALEAGITAHWWGAVPAVIIGGGATVGVALAFGWIFPALRRVDSLNADRLIEQFQAPHDRHGVPVAASGRRVSCARLQFPGQPCIKTTAKESRGRRP